MAYRYHHRPCAAYSKVSRTRATLTVRNALRVESAGLSDVTWKGSSYFNFLPKRHSRPRPAMVSPNFDKPARAGSLAADRRALGTHLAELARLMQEGPRATLRVGSPRAPQGANSFASKDPDPTAIATPFLWSVGCDAALAFSRRQEGEPFHMPGAERNGPRYRHFAEPTNGITTCLRCSKTFDRIIRPRKTRN